MHKSASVHSKPSCGQPKIVRITENIASVIIKSSLKPIISSHSQELNITETCLNQIRHRFEFE